ncbi:Tat pathway signal sequence domain protein OS=Streptomyces canus OX=58343 GN=AQI96_31185 PE=4 SV=1 [Streptomyces canus]
MAGGAALLAAGAGSAAAAGPVREPYLPLTVGGGGGPVGTDRVHVLKVGPDTARTVLVMVPGMFGAANDFRWAARDLVAAVPGVQVWAFDRREENLADRSGFRTADPAAYYLDGHYRSQDPAASAFAAGWGLTRTLEDLRAVVRAAARGGRRVVLGGHSWGATTAMAYAAWDFDGCPGYRDVAALVLVDGGVRGAFDGTGEPVADSPEQVKERLAAIEGGAVFDMTLSAVGLGDRAESTQIWYQLAGWYAQRDPDGPSVLQPRMPDALRPPVQVTNAGLLGTLVDAGIGWPNDISVHSGHLADSGEPRGWVDDGITPIDRVATAYAGGPEPAVWEWYWPARLSVDLDVTDSYADTDTARSLGLRLKHAAGLDVPLYAFQTSYAKGTIVSAAREVVADSRIPYATYETDNGMNHLDPLFAAPQHNTFTRTLAPFLSRLLT